MLRLKPLLKLSLIVFMLLNVLPMSAPRSLNTPLTVTNSEDRNKPFLTDNELENYTAMSEDQIRRFFSKHKSYFQKEVLDTDGSTLDASKVIAEASNQYRINPQVLLATMQKEQAAVTSPTEPEMDALMGCLGSTARAQLMCAARTFRSHQDALTNTGQTINGWKVGVPKDTEDEVTVTPATKATAGQFAYTPHAGKRWGGTSPGGVSLFYTEWKDFNFDTPYQVPTEKVSSLPQQIRLAPATDNPDTQCYVLTQPKVVHWDGNPLYLTSKSTYISPYAVDDGLTINVLHVDDNSLAQFTRESNTLDKPAEDISQYFHRGDNKVTIALHSNQAPKCGSSELWIVSRSLLSVPPGTSPRVCEGKTPSGLAGAVSQVKCGIVGAFHWLRATVFRHSNADIALVGPDGTVYDQYSQGINYERTDEKVTITVEDPQPGDWDVVVTALETAPEGTSFDYVVDQFEPWNDSLPPVTTATLTCSRDMNGVCRSEGIIDLSASDTGSGVDRIECSFDNGTTWEWCGDADGGQFIIGLNGQTQFLYRAIDRARNVESVKNSGSIDVQRLVVLADNMLSSTSATTIQTKGVAHSNGDVALTNNTTVNIDTLNYRGQFTQSGNVSLTINQQAQVTESVSLPTYPLSHYDERCTRLNGPLVIDETSPVYDNLCVHASGPITNTATSPSGSLTLISDNQIGDWSTNANLQPADRVNGVQFYALAGYHNHSTGATINGIILAPAATIDGPFTNSTLNGGLFARTVSLGSGTTLNAQQAPGFPVSTYTLPLQPMTVAPPDPLPPLPSSPTSLFPVSGRVMSNGRFALSWNVGSGAVATHVQVATSNTFDAASLKVDLYRLGNSHSVNLSPGNYFWRAASVNRAGEVWSGTVTFTVQSPTPTRIPTPTSTPVPAINRLVNPGFELDNNNDGRSDNWTSDSRFTRSNAMVHGGSYAGKHYATDNSGYTISQTITGLTAGTTYTFSGWVNIPPTSDAFMLRIEVQWQNSSNAAVGISSVKTYTTATSGWNQATATFVAPPTTTNAAVRMVVTSLNATGYVDDFEFK